MNAKTARPEIFDAYVGNIWALLDTVYPLTASHTVTERRIKILLMLGHGTVLALVISLGFVVVLSMQRLSAITDDLYTHPFAVSNAAVEAEASIALIRERMLELVLADNPAIASHATETQTLDASARANLATVKSQFPGDTRKVDEVERWLDDCSRLRSSISELVADGRQAQASDLVRTAGADIFSRIQANMDYVVGFARHGAKAFTEEARREAETRMASALALLAVLAALVGVIGWMNGRRILAVIHRERTIMAALQVSEERFREALENAPTGMVLVTPDGKITRVNRVFCKMLGYRPEELVQLDLAQLIHAGEREDDQQRLLRFKAGQDDSYEVERRLLRKDGAPLWVQICCSLVRGNDGSPREIIKQVQDITERRYAVDRDRLMATVLDNVFDGVVTIGEDGIVDAFNKAAETIFGYRADEVIGRSVKILMPESYQAKHDDYLSHYLASGEKTTIGVGRKVRGRRKDGSSFPMDLAVSEIQLGTTRKFTGIVRDITEREKAEQHIHRLAHYDGLTGLPNRTLFLDRLRQVLLRAQRENTEAALMFLDLDKFKPINDSLGHDVGDRLLRQVATRLQHCVRESDTVARLAGDEFVVLMPSIAGIGDSLLVADKILQTLRKPFVLSGQRLEISSSIGVAVYPHHGGNRKELLKCADIAMYDAKKAGRNTYRLYQASANGS